MEDNQDEVNTEFEELRIRWDNFIAKFAKLSPEINAIKKNVFYELVTETRTKESMVKMARGTRPFIAKELWNLLETFMDFMRHLPGLEGENYRAVYDNMTPAGLIKRLLTKRPIVFLNEGDGNVLRNEPLVYLPGRTINSIWNEVALNLEKKSENSPYLCEYISYDEMLLSAYVNMSTPTYFVGEGGGADAFSKPTEPFVSQGVLCGLVGARLEKLQFMEERFVFPRSDDVNRFFDVHHSDEFWIKNLYPDAFPEGKIPTEVEVSNNPELYENIYVDGINVIYFRKRLALSVVPFIEEAIQRGIEKQQRISVSVPPIGAGVWCGNAPSETINVLIVSAVLDYLDNDFDVEKLKFLAVLFLPETEPEVYSSYLHRNKISTIKVSSTDATVKVLFKGENQNFLTIINDFRYIAELLPPKFSSCLVIAGYAWDGNAYPGNEYWIDSYCSFDPQAVLCSCIGQFQNPEVNVRLADPQRIKIY